MQINRHNYEEFFLLYVDKELSAADRKAVDVFVQQNPDLQIELVLLQQTVLKADDIVLNKKDWLYMEEDITALQEDLLLYTDNELSPADKSAMEILLATDKTAGAELKILEQIKFKPDTSVVFPDKQSLYRKEKGRVVGIIWGRVAAAAVLVGISLWTAVSVYQNNFKTTTSPQELAKQNNTDSQQTKKGLPVNSTAVIPVPGNSPITANSATTSSKSINTEKNNKKINSNSTELLPGNVAVQKNNAKQPGNNLPDPSFEKINNKESNEKVIADVIPSNNNNSRVSGNNVVVKNLQNENTMNTLVNNNSKPDQAVAIVQASNNKTVEEDNNSRYMNLDDDKEKRTTLGGLIRKAKRVVGRTTNINTGEGIKIAGFEIALK